MGKLHEQLLIYSFLRLLIFRPTFTVRLNIIWYFAKKKKKQK